MADGDHDETKPRITAARRSVNEDECLALIDKAARSEYLLSGLSCCEIEHLILYVRQKRGLDISRGFPIGGPPTDWNAAQRLIRERKRFLDEKE